ncbi:MAG: aminotransferase class I/II-fold pyridoxal phosphate-dependent enzyme [Candidatus Dormibacteraeota bacterium]|nr:aminotransferase class I/II-fold pyridoxal phosphate-dependent enzyme [Candidatus Dormibacteraeota bacterium]
MESGIRASRLRPGEPLPPVRALARRLSVSPTTVAAAYRDLQARGFIVASGRRGTLVRPAPPPMAWTPPVPAGVRDLTTGNPDPELLPDLRPALLRIAPGRRLYGEPANHAPLLELAAERFRADGLPAHHLAVVGGALDGIDRILATSLRPGDRVGVEDPGYPELWDMVRALGLVLEPLPVDARGPMPEGLDRALPRLAAVIVTPRGQNPTGAALDPERAAELRHVLTRTPRVLVVEDDHSGNVAGAEAATVTGAHLERWAIVRSASKSLGPDLRLAVVTGDALTVAKLEDRQRLGTGWVSHILQRTVVELAVDPEVRRLVKIAAERYAERRRAVVEALSAHGIEVSARSGLNVWVPVRDEAVTVRRLLQAGWAVAAGERFRHRAGPGVRISIGNLAPAEAEPLARVLAERAVLAPRTRSA